MAEALAADSDGGAPRRSDKHAEGRELHGVIVKGAAGEDCREELGGRGVVGGRAEVAEEEAVVEELGDAVERGVGDLGGRGLEGEDQRVERGGGGGDGQAEERRGVRRGRVGRRVRRRGEEVERRLGRGDERRVLPPRRVFDDAVERRAEHAARRGRAAERRRGGRHGGSGGEVSTRWSSPSSWSLEAERSERREEEEGWNKW